MEKIREKNNKERNEIAKKNYVENAKKIHGNKYNYSKTFYTTNKQKVEVICPVHGSFFQRACDHLLGAGCPLCRKSKGEELIINFLEKNNVEYEREKTFNELVFIKKLRLDFYLASQKVAIEFNGIQHYKQVDGFKSFEAQKKKDEIKKKFCRENNIKLITITFFAKTEEDIKNIFIKHKII